ncbi:MAG: ABC transporter ATP-binding protein [Bdellovibrionales bacterium]|nr:ABC transporter ATP-binding protein [Bdellovibrionales bacterium]
MNSIPLQIKNLVKKYGSATAVNDVSFEVHPGEIFGLLGPNGAGKTSIISCLVTLQEPTSGEISIYGRSPQTSPTDAKRLVGFVPQEVINHGYFDVYEILDFHSGYFGKRNNREKIEYLLHRLGLWEHRHKKVKALSGGMKRRLLIAKALVHDPQLLLLDEPTAGVDIELRASLWDFVEELKKNGMSILLTTHYLEEAEKLCDRVGILQNGKLRTVGNTKQLIDKMTKRKVTLKLKTSGEISHAQLISHVDAEWQFLVEPEKGIGQLLDELGLSAQALIDVKIEEGSLEDAFRHVLGSEA